MAVQIQLIITSRTFLLTILDIDTIHVKCKGGTTGEIHITASGGTPIPGIPGTYNYELFDMNGI